MLTLLEWVLALLLVFVLLELGRLRSELNRVVNVQYRIGQKLGVSLDAFDPPSAEVRDLAQRPSAEVDAIRAYRKQTGADLKYARAAVKAISKQS